MDKNVLNKLKDEVLAKADDETLAKLKNVKSPREALSVLEGVSIDLDDEMLAAVSGGSDDDDCTIKWCSTHCLDNFPPF